MQNSKVFNHQLFGQLKVNLVNEKELFSLNDVAWSLGYTRKSKGADYLRHDRINSIINKLGLTTVDHGGQLFIDESALYDFVFEAGTLRARDFRKWITSEVIPSIRKHGAYATPDTIENIISDPEFGIKLLTNLKEEKDKRMEAERLVNEQKPKVVFAESCLVSQDTILVKEVAKLACNQGIMIGQNKLYNKLRDWNYIQKNNTQPTQRAIESGFFQVLQRTIHSPEGEPKLTRTTKVTTKGQLHILNRLKKEKQKEVI